MNAHRLVEGYLFSLSALFFLSFSESVASASVVHDSFISSSAACPSYISPQDRADRQSLDSPGSFSMILLGDPQGYIKYDLNQPLFELCTAWCADNKENLNIKAVLCTGDLVEQNENFDLDPRMLNQDSEQMWKNVSRSFERLDGVLPYIICPGNHDYGFKHSENTQTHFPEYFPEERNACWKDCLVSVCESRNGILSLENAAFEFDLPYWGKILIITTEHGPCDRFDMVVE